MKYLHQKAGDRANVMLFFLKLKFKFPNKTPLV